MSQKLIVGVDMAKQDFAAAIRSNDRSNDRIRELERLLGQKTLELEIAKKLRTS